jgi:hypothetical protein
LYLAWVLEAADRLAELDAENERLNAWYLEARKAYNGAKAEMEAERALADELAEALFNEMGDGGSARPAQWMIGSYEALRAYQAAHPEGARK